MGRLLRRHGIVAGRGLGQHFLCDPRILGRIVEAADITAGLPVLEVGPGVGVLTGALALAGARVTAVELDRRLRPALLDFLGATLPPQAGVGRQGVEAAACGGFPCEALAAGLRVCWGDAVRLPWAALAAQEPGPWRVCSNLPYYITGPFLASLFEGGLPWSSAILLVQAQAADRMAAAPGTKAYGAFTCLVAYHATVERLFSVGRGAFLPPPAVDSVVVRLRCRSAPPTDAPRVALLRVIRAAFAQRRKTLRNALAAGLAAPAATLEAAFVEAGLDGSLRGERLDLESFGRLTRALLGRGFSPGARH